MLIVGAIGFAAYKLITSGALKKFLAEIAELPIEVNGQRKRIGTAIQDDAYIEGLLRTAVMAKLKTIAEHDDQLTSFSSNTPRAAMDVAQMLRDALNERMKQMPYRS